MKARVVEWSVRVRRVRELELELEMRERICFSPWLVWWGLKWEGNAGHAVVTRS